MITSPDRGRRSKCRFCDAAPVTKTYQAALAPVSPDALTIVIDDLEWNACSICSALIDSNQWDALNERVLEAWVDHFKAQGIYLDFAERDRLRKAIIHSHAVIRDAIARNA
jgi:hypothetical protein